ncbi:MAG: hypothetical protein E6F98_15735 [Actinobacteria bacterium]|nr:MAG: hypothetical protein E6F98_15735 [Actinomycetota bacterium]
MTSRNAYAVPSEDGTPEIDNHSSRPAIVTGTVRGDAAAPAAISSQPPKTSAAVRPRASDARMPVIDSAAAFQIRIVPPTSTRKTPSAIESIASAASARCSASWKRRELSTATAARAARSSASRRSSSVKTRRDSADTKRIAPSVRLRAISGTYMVECTFTSASADASSSGASTSAAVESGEASAFSSERPVRMTWGIPTGASGRIGCDSRIARMMSCLPPACSTARRSIVPPGPTM